MITVSYNTVVPIFRNIFFIHFFSFYFLLVLFFKKDVLFLQATKRFSCKIYLLHQSFFVIFYLLLNFFIFLWSSPTFLDSPVFTNYRRICVNQFIKVPQTDMQYQIAVRNINHVSFSYIFSSKIWCSTRHI